MSRLTATTSDPIPVEWAEADLGGAGVSYGWYADGEWHGFSGFRVRTGHAGNDQALLTIPVDRVRPLVAPAVRRVDIEHVGAGEGRRSRPAPLGGA
jgi:hypothetical protein